MPSKKLLTPYKIILIILLITFMMTIVLFIIFKNSSYNILFLFNKSLDYSDIQKSVNIPNNYVTRVIDGDTLELYSGDKVRLICVDALELGSKKSYEAKEFLESLVLYKEIRLEKDITETDKYGRLLRYVYVNDSFNEGNEIFVNKELIRGGYANVFRYGNNTRRCDEIEINNNQLI